MGKVNPQDRRFSLGGSRDADLEGIDDNLFDVFTDEEKLANAQRDFPKYDWFTSFTVKPKPGKQAGTPTYTLKFDKPASGTVYYYMNGQVFVLTQSDAEDKGNKKRVKVTLSVDDPPVGVG